MMSLAFASVLLAGGMELAEPTTVAPAVATAPAKAAAKPRPGEMVCKREPVLGSRMKERVCMTQADWDERKAEARDHIEKVQTNNPIK